MNQSKGIVLVLATAIISGLAIFINQFGVQVISSDVYTFLKNLVAGVLVLGMILMFREWSKVKKLRIKDLGLLSLIGFIGGSVPFLLFFKGLSLSTASNGALIHKSMFLPVAVLAVIFLKEKLNKWLMSGILLLLIGNVLLLKFNAQTFLQRGDLLILMATILWAIESIISKKAVSIISPRIVAASRMFFGCLFIMIYLVMTGHLSQISQLNLSQLSWVWLTGVILTGYLLTWYAGLKHLKVSTAVCLLALGSPLTTILELIQGQALSINQQFSSIVFILGIGLVIYSIRPEKSAYEIV